jgi:hypothetical protein
MKKQLYIAGILVVISSSVASAQSWKKLSKDVGSKVESVKGGTGLSEDEVGAGLKEALTQGVEKGVAQLSQADGYFKDPQIKIPMPDEAVKVEEKLRSLGQGEKVDEAILSMNRAAEDAASSAKDLFVAAIKGMTITDAMNILKGDDDAATSYLRKSTNSALIEKFRPIIKVSLDKVGATKHWETVFSTYNKVPFVAKVNPDLEEYVTEKAITGLFIQVAKEELQIRKDPAARATDLLKKVFGN